MNNKLVHFSLREVVSLHCSQAWFKAGIDCLKAGGSSAEWHCMMYGC